MHTLLEKYLSPFPLHILDAKNKRMFWSSIMRYIFTLHRKEYFLFIPRYTTVMILHEKLQFIYVKRKIGMVAPCNQLQIPIFAGLLPKVKLPHFMTPYPPSTRPLSLSSYHPANTCNNCIQTTLFSRTKMTKVADVIYVNNVI
jgi:hypothetical protein